MYVIGLTGGIGSGKSTVAQMLKDRGAVLLSADRIGHEVYTPGMPAWQEITDVFGREVLATDGSIDRKKLGAIVFADARALQKLNAITHPRMKDLMRQKIDEQERAGAEVAVLEAALLFDAGWDDLTDEVWVTVAPPEVAARRTAERSGISIDEALARIRAQMSNEERIRRSDVIINTDCDIEETRQQVESEWSRLRAKLAGEAGSPSRSASV